jgi:lipid II:glycine glycyltransferase (peptidoglycan interpeptide bridge formation enzyme)
MEFVTNIEEKEYENFVSKNKKSHFMQSYYWGEVMKYKNFTPHYVGIKKDGVLVATALLLEKKMFKNLSYFYCPRGYIMDYSDYALLEKFTTELISYAKEKHAIYIKIDPDIKRHNLDVDGNIDSSYNNYDLMEKLNKLGYKHKGFNTEFVNEQPRFTFRLNLEDDFENIYARMHATTRKILNKKNQYDLTTYIGTIKDIPDFYITMEETAEREGLACNPIKYYEEFYQILNEHGMSDLYVVKANISKLKNIYQSKIDELNKDIKDLEIKSFGNKQKTENKISEYKNEIGKVQKDFDLVNSIKDEEAILSSIITVKYNDKVWTIHGGNTTLLRNLNSNYWLYYTIIKDAHDNGYKVIDFFGTSGIANPDKSNPVYGIHNFKKRLGGEYTEFIGEYDLVCNKLMYDLYNLIIPIRRKIVKTKLKKKGN